MLRPGSDRDRNWQHGPPKDYVRGNGKKQVANNAAKQSDMLAAQRKTPLQPKKSDEYSDDERSAGVVEKGDRLHEAKANVQRSEADWQPRLTFNAQRRRFFLLESLDVER